MRLENSCHRNYDHKIFNNRALYNAAVCSALIYNAVFFVHVALLLLYGVVSHSRLFLFNFQQIITLAGSIPTELGAMTDLTKLALAFCKSAFSLYFQFCI